MARKFFRRFMPSRQRLEGDQTGRLRRILAHPRAWQINRHSVSRGLAIGMFWAWIPLPVQTPFACFFAWKWKGNVPLAFACCWISNPITMLPVMYVCYQLGLLVTFQPGMPSLMNDLKAMFDAAGDHGLWTDIKIFLHYVWSNLGVIWPLLVGCVVFSSLNAIVAYFGAQALWRLTVVRRWKKRGHKVHCRECHRPLPHEKEMICPYCGAPSPHRTRIGLGLAALARVARKQPLAPKNA